MSLGDRSKNKSYAVCSNGRNLYPYDLSLVAVLRQLAGDHLHRHADFRLDASMSVSCAVIIGPSSGFTNAMAYGADSPNPAGALNMVVKEYTLPRPLTFVQLRFFSAQCGQMSGGVRWSCHMRRRLRLSGYNAAGGHASCGKSTDSWFLLKVHCTVSTGF